MYVFVYVSMCVHIYIYMYTYMHDLLHPCQVWSYFWASAQTFDCFCQWVHTIVLMSRYLFRSLYILCTACRILAYRLMFFVLHTTRNKAYLILSYLKHNVMLCVIIEVYFVQNSTDAIKLAREVELWAVFDEFKDKMAPSLMFPIFALSWCLIYVDAIASWLTAAMWPCCRHPKVPQLAAPSIYPARHADKQCDLLLIITHQARSHVVVPSHCRSQARRC